MIPGRLPRPTERSHPPVCYRCRETGATVREPLSTEGRLRWAYETAIGGAFYEPFFRWPLYSRLVGHLMASPGSRKRIPAYVERFGIDASELELPLEAYESFAAFFERRLRPEARPFDPDPDVLPSPGDGKALVFPSLGPESGLPVKGGLVSVSELLGEDASAYRDGAALVLRLAPYDYHRFHFVADGLAGPCREIPGRLYSVNPIALGGRPDIFLRNRRMVGFQQTERFGRIAYVEVGAFEVGCIVQTHATGPVARGQEKGYFRLGGSTLVVLFEPGRQHFDADLIQASAIDLETRVWTGMGLGRKVDV